MTKTDIFLSHFQKISATSKIFLLQNLSIMVKAGIPLASSIKTLAEQTKQIKMKIILTDLSEKIGQGKSLYEGLESYKKDFGEMFINMIRAGEASGRLDEILRDLYTQTKKDHELKSKIKGAMTYPTIIICAVFGIGAFMMVFVLPNITKVFSDTNIQLPLITQILIGTSNFITNNWIVVLISLVLFFFIITKAIKTKIGKSFLDKTFLATPVLGTIIQKINLAQFSRSISSLIKSDIDIVEAFTITSRTLNNSLYRQALIESSEQIKKGEKIEAVFKNYPKLFPPSVIQMISVGEETGSLDQILENLSGFYEEEVSQTMDSLPTIIEPVLMIFIGIAVGGVALAIMMPIYSLTEAF